MGKSYIYNKQIKIQNDVNTGGLNTVVSYYRGMLWGSKYDKIKIVKIKAKFYMKMLWEFDYDTEKYLCTFFWGSNLRNFYTLQNSLLYNITQYYSLLY
jgi:hypothetical protein